jgi:hypothetical protein
MFVGKSTVKHISPVSVLRAALWAAVFVSAPLLAEARPEDVPVPKPRPAFLNDPAVQQTVPPRTALAEEAGPTECELRLAKIAAFASLPVLTGPGQCGATEAVRLDAVLMPDGSRVPISPPATLRCTMAEAFAQWVREDIGGAANDLGSRLATISGFDSYECRGRNRISTAKVSEHGRANAIDIRGVKLANGTTVDLTSASASKPFRERVRTAACRRFMTVLGPGSDGYHEDHIHVDLAERRSGYRMCQWDLREPPAEAGSVSASAPTVADVPLPRPRPFDLTNGQRAPL